MTDWSAAACRDQPTDWWYPLAEAPGTTARAYRRAREICADCPIRVDCLEVAMRIEGTAERRYGMWGGLTPDERTTLARRRQKKEPA